MYQVLQVKPAFLFDSTGMFANNSVWIIPKNDKYLLGILNSKIGWFLISKYCTEIQNGYQLIYEYLSKIPIKQIDFTNPSEKKKHDEIVKHVETMLKLNKELRKAKLAAEQEQIKQRITYTDKKIDALVYELYGLTEEEIKIVEYKSNNIN